MKKIILSLVAIVFVFFFLFNSSSLNAQTPTTDPNTPGGAANEEQPGGEPGAQPQAWKCMDNRPLSTEEKNIIPEGTPSSPNGLLKQRRFTSVSGLDPESCYYKAVCISTSEGIQCTTGKDDYDKALGWTKKDSNGKEIGNYTYLNSSKEDPLPLWFISQGGSYVCNPPGGKIESVVVSATDGMADHSWYAITLNVAKQQNEGKDTETATLHYGTLQFSGNPSACEGVRWDPMMRTFDAETLEPVETTLLIKDENGPVQQPGVTHTQKTDKSGTVSWLTDPGTYYIDVVAMPAGYSYSDSPALNPNWTKAYGPLLLPGMAIIEKAGELAQADIALTTNSPIRRDPEILKYKVVQTGPHLLVQGTNTHPFTEIAAMQESTIVGQGTADRFGYFTIKIPNSKIGSLPIKLILTKKDLTREEGTQNVAPTEGDSLQSSIRSYIVKPVLAQQQTALTIEPIPTYIEGYAYDETKTPLPYATVSIKLKMTDSTYYQTIANENGYFIIQPGYLPIIGFYIEYKPADSNTTIKTTVVNFAVQNEKYLTSNDINIMNATKQGKALIVFAQDTNEAEPTAIQETKTEDQPKSAVASTTANFFTIIIIALAIVIVGIALFLYLKSRASKEEEPQEYKKDDPQQEQEPPSSINTGTEPVNSQPPETVA